MSLEDISEGNKYKSGHVPIASRFSAWRSFGDLLLHVNIQFR